MKQSSAIKKNPRHLIALLLGLVAFSIVVFVVVKATAQCAPDDLICQSMP